MNGPIDKNTHFIMSYADTTQRTCMCTAVAIVLIIAFIMTPLNDFVMTSFLAKIVISILLSYSIFATMTQTTALKTQYGVSLIRGEMDSVKMNVICSYAFSAFSLFLLFSVLSRLFSTRTAIAE
jgi:hypothetical protein